MHKRLLTVLMVLIALAAGSWTLAQDKKAPAPAVQTAKVMVGAEGFKPSSVELKANTPAKITFTRTAKETCATSVVVPDYKIKKDLPLNTPVDVEFTPTKAGTVAFACGMNMFKGAIVVK